MHWTYALLAIAALHHLAAKPPGAGVRTLFVAADFVGVADGSIERPFRTIHAAVRAARDGDTIAVAHGRYAEGNIDLRHKTLTLLGGFERPAEGRSGRDFETRDWRARPTIVVGSKDTTDYERDPAAVFRLAGSAGGRIDGFTITGGRHGIFAQYASSTAALVIANNIIEDNGIETPTYYEYGGGIHSAYKSIVVENNVIRRNRSGRGGGIAALGEGDARIENNIIEENIALGDHGGGIYLQQHAVVRDNIIRANAVSGAILDWLGGVGGGIAIVAATARLSQNVITDNYARKCGAGVLVDEGAMATMERDIIRRNRPVAPNGWGGAGIYVDGGAETTTRLLIDRSIVVDNAPNGPGVGNGLFVASRAQVTLEHSIVENNGAEHDFEIVDESGTSFIVGLHSIAISRRETRARK